jgi:hypothetical protein
MELDHIAVAGATLATATDYVARTLGVVPQLGGQHAVFHTHNTLLGLDDGLYLEAIATNPDAPLPDRARWFGLDRFEGPARLTNWVCRCDNLDATLALLPDGFGEPVDLQRGDLHWRMAVPRSGALLFDNCAPALMAWQGDAHPAQRLDASNCRLTELTVCHPDVAELTALLAPFLKDTRIAFLVGEAGLKATFDTLQGPRTLK